MTTEPTPVTLPTKRTPGCPFDPPPELERLRATGPVTRMRYADGHVGWLVTGYAAARTVLTDPRFSSRRELRHTPLRFPGAISRDGQPAPRGFFINNDPPEHTRYRRLLTRQFTVHRLKRLEPRIAQITAEHLDAMAAAGPPADLVPAFALPIPSLVICELLGVPYTDRATFQQLTTTAVTMDRDPGQASAAIEGLFAYVRDLVQHKRARPTDDLLSGLITGGELTDVELTSLGFLLLTGGHETTAKMLALGTFALLQHPEPRAAFCADASSTDTSLTETAVEELLRYLTILHLGPPAFRAALEDVELDGQLIRAGETVTVALAAVNRDPTVFTDPDTLTLDRANARHHLAFGHGVHQCLGQQLARIEMRIAYRALFARFPTLRLAVPAAEVPLRENAAIYGVWRLPVTWDQEPAA